MSNRRKKLSELTPNMRASSAHADAALVHPAMLESGEILCMGGETRDISVAKASEHTNPSEDSLRDDRIHAQDILPGALSVNGPPVAPERFAPKALDSVPARAPTPAEVYRGKKPPELYARVAPKQNARIYPRMKFMQNDPCDRNKGRGK